MVFLHITIDTEFDHCAPVREQAIYCRIGGRSHGLGFVLDSFARFGIRATFFVETAHTLLLGPEPMRPVVDAILAAGHDVQMHVHPLWLGEAEGWAQLGDAMHELDEACCRRLIEAGQASFAAWQAPPPLAFRAGNLAMGRNAYRALRACGIAISSSVGVAIHASAEPELWIENGRRVIEGVVEVPVLGYADAMLGERRHIKNLTITGSGARETIALLRRAEASGIEDIVLLTHPFEFVKRLDEDYIAMEPSRVNQTRLRALCEWVSASSDCRSATFRERAPIWIEKGSVDDQPLAAPLSAALTRMVENKLNDLIRWY
jgi:hypothetical protein